MRLGFLTTMERWSPPDFLWVAAATRARAEGHEVWIVVRQDYDDHGRFAELTRAGAKFVRWPAPVGGRTSLGRRSLRWGRRALGMSAALSAAERFWQAPLPVPLDLLCLTQGGAYCAVLLPGLLPWLKRSGTPYFLVSQSARWHGRNLDSHREVAISLYAGAVCSAFASEQNRRAVALELALHPPGGLVLQNPLSLPDPTPLTWPADAMPSLACVARMDLVEKGQDLLLEALSGPAWREREFRLSLYGLGPDLAHTRRLATFLGVADRVRFAGFAPDTREIWREHHVIVLPSRSEGLPLSLLEALLCGRPAVVTAVGGNADWVTEGRTGWLAEHPTGAAMAAALERAWQARDRWRAMGAAASVQAQAQRDPDPPGTLLRHLLASAHTVAHQAVA